MIMAFSHATVSSFTQCIPKSSSMFHCAKAEVLLLDVYMRFQSETGAPPRPFCAKPMVLVRRVVADAVPGGLCVLCNFLDMNSVFDDHVVDTTLGTHAKLTSKTLLMLR